MKSYVSSLIGFGFAGGASFEIKIGPFVRNWSVLKRECVLDVAVVVQLSAILSEMALGLEVQDE